MVGSRMANDDEPLPADLEWFLRAAEIAPTIDGGFALNDVQQVESAWLVLDGDLGSFGWVIATRDGRRLYLEYTIDDSEDGRPEDLCITPLAEGQTYPDMDNSAGVYWYRPDYINEHLGLAPTMPPGLN
jgi:hypothetical protein